MKLKRSDIIGLGPVFNSLMEIRLDPNVAYKVASNGILANEFTEKIKKTYNPMDGFREVEELRQKILDDAGAKPSGNGVLTISPDKAVEVNRKMAVLNEEHKNVIDAQEEYQKEFNELLELDEEIDFKTIGLEELKIEIEPGKLVLLIKNGILTNGNKS